MPPKYSPRRSFFNNGGIDLACGYVAVLGQINVDKPLVVAQVEIRLGAVIGYKHLSVLIGTHRSRVYVNVRIELLDGNL